MLVGLLGGCAVYDRVFHPHRLPTPTLSPTARAKAKAAEKARHKGTSLKAMEAASATDGAGADAGAAADEKKKPMSYSDLPEGTRLKYDKQGLVKKSTLNRLEDNRRKLHHYDTRPLTPREASRENRKLRKKGHQDHKYHDTPPKGKPRDKEQPTEPAPDPTQPAEPIRAPAPKAKEPKVKGKKARLPKPDPTQPAPDGSHP
jgi:hypothetical protein